MEVEVEELRAELLLWALLLEEVEPPTLDTDHVLTVMPPPACEGPAGCCIRGRPCCGYCMLAALLVSS